MKQKTSASVREHAEVKISKLSCEEFSNVSRILSQMQLQIYYIFCVVQNKNDKIMKKRFDEVSERFLRELETNDVTGYKLMKDKVIRSQTSLSSIKNGKQKVSRRMIDTCADLYGLNKAYILMGNISNTNGDQTILTVSNNSTVSGSNNKCGQAGKKTTARRMRAYIREELVDVPFVPQDATASFVENFGDMQSLNSDTYGVMQEEGEDLQNGQYVVFQVAGESMTPSIPDEAKVLAASIPEEKWEEANGVVFVLYGKMLTIKRVLKNSLYLNNIITLKADNPVYGQVDIERNEIRGIWQAERIVSQKIK